MNPRICRRVNFILYFICNWFWSPDPPRCWPSVISLKAYQIIQELLRLLHSGTYVFQHLSLYYTEKKIIPRHFRYAQIREIKKIKPL